MEALYTALMQSPAIGEVGPRGAKWRNGQHVALVGEEQTEEADAISGFLFMIKEPLFREIGGFDVRYTPAGFEEVDMSYENSLVVTPHERESVGLLDWSKRERRPAGPAPPPTFLARVSKNVVARVTSRALFPL